MIEEETQIQRQRNRLAGIVTCIVIALVFSFVWRVIFFTHSIQKGTLDISTFDFSSRFTPYANQIVHASSKTLPTLIDDDDPFLGTPGAPITIVEFADFGCPYSRESSFVLRELAQENSTKLFYLYRDFPIVELHPIAQAASEASMCAHAQGKFWEYHDKLYQNQNALDEYRLMIFAESLNLNMNAFRSCVSKRIYEKEVEEDYEAGLVLGVEGTPTFFVNGVKISGAIPKELLEEIIQQTE